MHWLMVRCAGASRTRLESARAILVFLRGFEAALLTFREEMARLAHGWMERSPATCNGRSNKRVGLQTGQRGGTEGCVREARGGGARRRAQR